MVFSAGSTWDTEAIGAGRITDITYREAYVIFRVVGDAGNHCAPCPADPGNYGIGQRCWIPASEQVLTSMVLVAKSQAKTVRARVRDWTNCEIYQFTILD